MASVLNPYLSFRDNAAEAMDFYKTVFGGTLTVSTFGEFGTEGPDAGLVMHAQLETDQGFTLMGADTPASMGMTYQPGTNITVSLSGNDEAELRGFWDRLADGATVGTPLEKQMWGDLFGQLVDRYGIGWLVNIAQPS